jgi:FkbM family methyltransferase
MNIKRFIGKCRKGLDIINLKAIPSYSFLGDDLIVNYLFNSLGIEKPTYLEIGTNDPIVGNNTYLFYSKGCKGVCIEPNIAFYKEITKKRPRDIVLNIGIGFSDNDSAIFYVFPNQFNGWNTFSEKDARKKELESGSKASEVIVPLKTINEIITKHFAESTPNFISLDAEGVDLDILQSLDFYRFQPDVICVETLSFSTKNLGEKSRDIIDFVQSKGYFIYADTHVNTIFCRTGLF